MSRLTFDDILKSNASFDPVVSRTSGRDRTRESKTEETSPFDHTLKQAVEERDPENKVADDREKMDRAETRDAKSRDDSARSKSESKQQDDRRETTANAKSSEASSNDTSNRDNSDNSDDADDALIARVMAAAQEQQEAMNTAEEASVGTGETGLKGGLQGLLEGMLDGSTTGDGAGGMKTPEGDTLAADRLAKMAEASQTTLDASGSLAEESLAAMSTETTGSDAQRNLSQGTDQTIATSEVVVPVGTQVNSGVAQTIASTTTDTATASAEGLSQVTTLGNADTTRPSVVSGKDAQRQGDMDQQENSEAEGGGLEGEATQKPSATTTLTQQTGTSSETDLTDESDDKQSSKVDTSAKVEGVADRLASTSENRSTGRSSATSTTQTQTQPGTEGSLDTADRVRFVERVARAFSAQSSENSPVRMRLYPEELGSIKIEMTVRNGAMHARVETETQEARNVLLDNLPALRERLATHNIKIEQFDIDYNAGGDQQRSPQNPGDWSESGHHGSRSSNEDRTTTAGSATETKTISPRAVSRAGSGKQLDVTI